MPDAKYFKLFASCIPVKGYKESLIYDLDRGKSFNIPNLLYEILLVNNEKKLSIPELQLYFNNLYDKGIEAFFEDFVNNEIGFYTNTPELFLNLNPVWKSPFRITNAILEVENLVNIPCLIYWIG